jgi:formylglycine-generating enzyme required for sulfatase activity
MAKLIRFDLPINGTKVKDLEELRDNLTEEIVGLARSGMLARWLTSRGHQSEAERVTAAVADHEKDAALCLALCDILGVAAVAEDLEVLFGPPIPAGQPLGATGTAGRRRADPQAMPAPQDIHGWSADQVQALQRSAAKALGLEPFFRVPLADGEGPEMAVIPPGSFLMGADESDTDAYDSEKPQHRVRIARPFAIGRYAVTLEEYDRFCDATGREQPDDLGWGRGRRPISLVLWDEAVAYCAWLTEQTGRTYRLPTEAEWEYAARAGTVTPYWWGKEIGRGNANCDGGGTQWDNEQTAPVGSFPPNPFGLYDTAGNVWEWMLDPWHDSYQAAPGDGAEWRHYGYTARRVCRGGSCYQNPAMASVSTRIWLDSDAVIGGGGFLRTGVSGHSSLGYRGLHVLNIGLRLAQDL